MPKPLINQLVDLVLPVNCLGCDKEGDWLCEDCQRSLTPIRSITCALCRKAATNGICAKCQELTKIDGIVSLFSYKDPAARKLITALKYRGYSDIIQFISKNFARKVIRQLPEDFVATFVPIDKLRLGKRGFNQSELLANSICGDSKPLFKKVISTPAQATLGQKDRRINLKKAFKTFGKIPERIVIFDDVITTGSTAAELAKIAKRRGALEVWIATIARD